MPEKKKVKIKSRPSSSGFTPMLEPAKEVLKMVGGYARRKLAENIMPMNYDDPTRAGGGSLQRGIDAVILNKKEQERAEKEQYIKKGYGAIATDEDKLRLDLLSEYGGVSPKYGMLSQSEYKPSKSANKSGKYLDSKTIKEGLLSSLKSETKSVFGSEDLPSIRNKEDIKNFLTKISESGSDLFERKEGGDLAIGGSGGMKAKVTGLGVANVAAGEDEKGPYISYYDVWDVDPTSGRYKTSEDGAIKSAMMRSGKNILAAGSTPPEVYGRIYFDKKTGKPIL